MKLIQLTNNNFNEKEKLPTRVDYVEKQELHPLHEKIFFVLQKFVKRAEKIIFSLVFMFPFHGNVIFSELSFKQKCKKAASFRKCAFFRKYEIFVYDSYVVL